MRSVADRALPPEQLAALNEWLEKAKTARDAVCDAPMAQRPQLMEQLKAIYQGLRDHLLWLFENKCAYCEIDYRSAPVQVEHFRPKRKVTGVSEHPGYYWLMFDRANLLPSCARCNNKKRNKFPIRGSRAMDPSGDIDAESPELLDPLRDSNEEIARHLEVVTDDSDPRLFGAIKSKNASSRATVSIAIYGLNDWDKIRARQSEMKTFLREFKDAFDDAARRNELLASIFRGRRQCSYACEAMLIAWVQKISQETESWHGPGLTPKGRN